MTTTKTYDLGEGASITLHQRIGRDMLKASAVYSQINAVKEGYSSDAYYQDRFAYLCAQCDEAKGMPFAFPNGKGEDAEAQAAYNAWLDLPAAQFNESLNALSDIDEPANSKELISPEKAGDKRKSPLSKSEEAKKESEPVSS